MTPSQPGMYFYTDPNGSRTLVQVCKTKGPNQDGKGPLFAEAYSTAQDKYFYQAISTMMGSWSDKIQSDFEGKPTDAEARTILEACLEAGTASKN